MSPAVVCDCTVYLQALASDGPAYALFERVEFGTVELFTSPPILAEVRRVLARPKLRKKNREITDERVDAFINKVAAMATVATDVLPLVKLPRDPADEPYLNLALTVGVPYLVSQDPDLLDLMADVAFRSANPALTILDPVAFLGLREWEPSDVGDPPAPAAGSFFLPPAEHSFLPALDAPATAPAVASAPRNHSVFSVSRRSADRNPFA